MKTITAHVFAVACRPAPGQELKLVGETHTSLETAQAARTTDKETNKHPTAIYRLAFGALPLFVEGDDLGTGAD